MTHGTERGHRMHSEFEIGDHAAMGYDETRCEKWCDHCKRWIEVHGVTGALRFMAEHDDGDCAGGTP